MNLAHLSVVDIQGAVNAKGTKIMGCQETSSVVNVADDFHLKGRELLVKNQPPPPHRERNMFYQTE